MIKKNKIFAFMQKLSPIQIITLGFFSIIFVGSMLLTLPISSAVNEYTNYIDALFTATTSVCVTGLVTVTTMTHWSAFGKVIILCLIQIGGLGFMTAVSLMFAILKRRLSVKKKLITQTSLNETGMNKITISVKKVVYGTIIVESIGAFLITISLVGRYPVFKSMKYGVFTSVSAFCNAGIDIFSMDSIISYNKNALLLYTIMTLIVIGGIGFPVWWELIEIIKKLFIKKDRWRMIRNGISLHFKIVVLSTLFLIISGFIFIFSFEYSNLATIGDMSFLDKVNNSFFQSVTLRTAGFASFSQSAMTESSKLISMLYMFIGGSPGSTAGGIKTVTFVLVVIMLISWIRDKDSASIFKKTIPDNLVKRALLVAFLNLALLLIAILILTRSEGADIITLSFEAVSAIGTVGLSLDFTTKLTAIGKIVIILLMFMGRIGPITLFMSMNKERKKVDVKYAEEKVLLG